MEAFILFVGVYLLGIFTGIWMKKHFVNHKEVNKIQLNKEGDL
jgi:hypothetical protein